MTQTLPDGGTAAAPEPPCGAPKRGPSGRQPLSRHQLARQGLHLACGAGAVLLKYWPLWAVGALIAAGIALSVSVHFFRGRHGLLRPGEGYFSGAVAYGLGVLAALWLLPAEAAMVGWLTLAAGDSAATIVGSRWPVARFAWCDRSLGGMLGFFALALPAALAGVWWWHGGATPAPGVFAALALAVAVCALAESLLPRLNDNLYIPLLGGALYWAAAMG